MSEGGDILYAKPPSTKPRTQQQLQQTADKARKHIPGAARLLAADTAALGCCRRPQGGGVRRACAEALVRGENREKCYASVVIAKSLICFMIEVPFRQLQVVLSTLSHLIHVSAPFSILTVCLCMQWYRHCLY